MTRTNALFGQSAAVNIVTAQYEDEPRPITFTAPLQLGEADLVGALYKAMLYDDPSTLEDLDGVRELVADQIVNAGLDEINEAYVRANRAEPGTGEYAVLQACRAAVRRVFGAALAPAPASPGVRRELAGVA